MKRNIKIFLIFSIIYTMPNFAQEQPFEIYLGINHQNVYEKKSNKYTGFGVSYLDDVLLDFYRGFHKDKKPIILDSGYGITAEFRYLFKNNFRISFDIGFDNLLLFQDDVLDEWEWRYWEDTYIDFLPGITADEVNRTLRYQSGDGIYSAVFEPKQQLKELKFAFSTSYIYQIIKKLSIVPSLQVGLSLYTRELEMREYWLKKFEIDINDTTLNYYYNFDLLHFAPDKKGKVIFVSPGLGIKYNFSENYDFEFDFKFFHYNNIVSYYLKQIVTSKANTSSFPIYSKYQLRIGIVFKY